MDVVSKQKRSEIMRAIKSRDSNMEMLLQKSLSKQGLRYRKNVTRLPGKPDIAFISKRIAVFLDSCFWHGCKRHCRLPASNRKYWIAKIKCNKDRDRAVNKGYKVMSWKAPRFWEHDLMRGPEGIVKKIKTMTEDRKS